MKRTWQALFGLLLLAAPVAAQAQFYYNENPGNSGGGFGNNTIYVTITGYYGPDGSVTIPGTIDGYTVTTIGEDAFLEEIGVTSVTIPASVTSIAVGAFSYSGLTDVTIPGSVTNIGPEAFADCPNLTNATLANGVTSIGASAFDSCSVLTNITIPCSVISIGPYAFNDCSSLTNARISDGVISIGDDAFCHCARLTSVTIPRSVINIGGGAFADSFWLTAITVDPQNPNYSSVDGVLFDKNATTLIEYPAGLLEGYTIPTGVATIGEGAFDNCLNLTNVTMPSSVTSIRDSAFNNCGRLTSVAIPISVTNIGANAFFGCNFMTSVKIGGNVTLIGAEAFYGCQALKTIDFEGNAPTADSTAFSYDLGATVYYLPGTTGWSSTLAGRPTALWHLPNPVILNNGPNFGVQSNSFGFTISWAANISVVVEASTDLSGSAWTPLQTNTLSNGSFFFSEPLLTNSSGRFYRVSSP